jgi:S1-C subfamily serine protease
MERVVFRHLSGSKANQVEEFPLERLGEIVIGRDPSAQLRYDSDRDDLVGRQHAKIVQDTSDPYTFTIVDLNSRNGTFVNRQRILGSVVIAPGDVLQFGPGGPEIEFDIDPLPAQLVKKTRVVGQSAAGVPTRVAGVVAPETSGGSRAPIGRQTVERMVTQANRDTRRTAYTVAAGIAAVLLLAFGVLIYRENAARVADHQDVTSTMARELKRNQAWTPEQIAGTYTDANVRIEVGWKLIETEGSSLVYQEYYVEERHDKLASDKSERIRPIPLYLRLPDGTIEPSLTSERGAYRQNRPIGGRHRGSGFVVTSDGFILTNRHVAATWETAYRDLDPGLLLDMQTRKLSKLDRPPMDWVPANSRLLGRRAISGKNVVGRLDYLDVVFPKTTRRNPARLAGISDRHDVAMIKIDAPQRLKTVELFDNYDTVQAGMATTVMGYPGVSPEEGFWKPSQDVFSRDPQVLAVADPTVTPGAIGRVLKGEAKPVTAGEGGYKSEFGDVYQLTINATGGGNSGGPLFDDKGRVIGIFFAGRTMDNTTISFAVPIRYGLELMSINKVIR